MIKWIPFNTEDEKGYTNKIIELKNSMNDLTEISK